MSDRAAITWKRPLWRRILRRVRQGIVVLLVLGVIAFGVAYVRSDNVCPGSGAPPKSPMKAIVYCDYGSPDVLKMADVEKPAPADDQLLVRVRAASVNPLDWHFLEGRPYLMRTQAGLRKPKDVKLGVDFAGTVEAVGSKVTTFRPGDDVFGGGDGAFAEYVCVGADRGVAVKPPSVSFEQAASVPIAALTALQGVRDKGKVEAGQKVLINGASGGVGTFAVQFAAGLGAHVTGVCSTRNVEMVRSLGAEKVVDYTKEDFTKGTETYDVILDNVGNRSLSECRRVLAPQGRYVLIGGGGVNDNPVAGPLFKFLGTVVQRPFISQQMGMMLAHLNKDDLAYVADLIQNGKVTPVIDRRYPFAQTAEALRYLEGGHARGKVVIDFEGAEAP